VVTSSQFAVLFCFIFCCTILHNSYLQLQCTWWTFHGCRYCMLWKCTALQCMCVHVCSSIRNAW